MKLKELEQILSSVKPFPNPKLELEQYATDAHIAARMVYTGAATFDDFEEKTVLDLGCGCGMLSIASLIMGASYNEGWFLIIIGGLLV
jgi:putative methylase